MFAVKLRAVRFVIDTSALVALSGIGRLDLLRARCGIVAVPLAVRREVVDQGGGWREAAAGQVEILSGEWLETVEVEDSRALSLRTVLGAGEAECLEFARVARIGAVLDDQAARREAQRLKLEFFGSLAVLAWSKEQGLVQSVRPLVVGMRRNGILLSELLVAVSLAKLDE